MNWDEVRGKWNQFKGDIRKKWGKLTNDDLESIAGERDRLIGKIQERYGKSRDEAQREVENFCSTCQPTSA